MTELTGVELVRWFVGHYDQMRGSQRWSGQASAARATGISQKTISEYLARAREGEDIRPNARTLPKLQRYYGKIQGEARKTRARELIEAADRSGWEIFGGGAEVEVEERVVAVLRRALRERLSFDDLREIDEWRDDLLRKRNRGHAGREPTRNPTDQAPPDEAPINRSGVRPRTT